MNHLKRFFFTALMFFAIIGYAQEKTPEEKATALTKDMKSKIGFNDDAYTKIYPINLHFLKETDILKKEESKAEKFKKLKQLDEDRDTELKKILTEEEFKKFKDYKTKNRKKFKDNYRERR
jgi:hypothetical protein